MTDGDKAVIGFTILVGWAMLILGVALLWGGRATILACGVTLWVKGVVGAVRLKGKQ